MSIRELRVIVGQLPAVVYEYRRIADQHIVRVGNVDCEVVHRGCAGEVVHRDDVYG